MISVVGGGHRRKWRSRMQPLRPANVSGKLRYCSGCDATMHSDDMSPDGWGNLKCPNCSSGDWLDWIVIPEGALAVDD